MATELQKQILCETRHLVGLIGRLKCTDVFMPGFPRAHIEKTIAYLEKYYDLLVERVAQIQKDNKS